MCCKNPANPQLRDAYAIVWEETKDNHVAGTVFMITSLRPDMYEKNMSSAGLISDNQNTFTIQLKNWTMWLTMPMSQRCLW